MRLCSLVLVLSLVFSVLGNAVTTPMDPVGIVVEASDARLSNGSVSRGTTVYDGDFLSTEPSGALSVRSGSAAIYLTGATRAKLHGALDPARGVEADLLAGTLVFSSAQAAAMEIRAGEVSIRPAADEPTLAQITVVNPKKLYISARRGSVIFSYRDESEVISEGQAYRVVLDPQPDDTGANSDPNRPLRKPARRRRGFLFFLLGGIAAASTVPRLFDSSESPFRP